MGGENIINVIEESYRLKRIYEFRKQSAQKLYEKYCSLRLDIENVNAKLKKFDKDNEKKLHKLQKQKSKYDRHFEGKSAPRHTLENRRKICEFLEIDYDDFCKYVKLEKLGRYWLYDAVIFYILDRIDEILKQRKDLAKQIDKSVSKIKLDMQPIVYQLTEVYSVYEICEYLDVDYKSLVGTDFNNVSPIDAIFDLKRNNQTFIPIDNPERLIETLADYVYLTPINLTAWKEPIRGMTKEDYMNYRLEYLKNERDTVSHYYRET